jgi:hypothetical protein
LDDFADQPGFSVQRRVGWLVCKNTINLESDRPHFLNKFFRFTENLHQYNPKQ